MGVERDTATHEMCDGVEIVRFRPEEGSGGVFGYIGEYAAALRAISRIVRRLPASYDVVHAASPPDLLLLAALPLRRRGAATILDHHDLSPELYEAKFGKRGPVYRSLMLAERLGMRLANVVISPNESFRRIAITRGRKAAEDVFVVRNGPDPQVFRAVTPDPALAQGERHLIGYVGRMGSQDGVLEALDALETLLSLRSDWHAVFVGDGEALEHARTRVSRSALASHVTFTGFVADRASVVRIISSCDVCISPEPRNPLNESSTLIKVAEYMSIGRPVVAFDLHETAATAGDAAVLVADRQTFAKAVSRLLDDPELRERMGAIGRGRVEQTLSWSASVSHLLDAYGHALERRGSSSGELRGTLASD